MSKFLIFVEDPGVTNMILEFPSFFQYLNADFQIIAVNYAKEILHKKNIPFISVENQQILHDFLRNKSYDFFLIGTSENKNSLGLELIKIAKTKNILSIGLIDMVANYQFRFSGNSNNPLKYRPDKVIVTDDYTKEKYFNLGFESENIYVCEHPQQARLKKIKNKFLKKKKSKNQKKGRWLFVAENTDQLNPKESFLSEEYTLRGRGDCKWRTGIVLEEIIDIIKTFSPRPNLVVRLHPKNDINQFSQWSKDITIDEIDDPLESIWESNIILGMSSNLLVEALYLDKPVFSVLTRPREKKYMNELNTNLIYSVSNRIDLKYLMKRLFKGSFPKASNQKNLGNKKNLFEVLSILNNK